MTKKKPAVKRRGTTRPKGGWSKAAQKKAAEKDAGAWRQEVESLQAEIRRLRGVIDEMGAHPAPKAPKAIGETLTVTEHHVAARLANLEAEVAKLK
jgi:hypothetical protein